MEYQQLLLLYNKLLEENAVLKNEIAELRMRLPSPITVEVVQESDIVISNTTVHNRSSSDEKIDLFFSLFRGREDVYAKRWYSPKSGKSGYQPVCANEWEYELCDKRKYKCNVCPNRKLLPIDIKAIEAHLRGNDLNGKDVIGIYPLLPDETCLFLVVDFDDDGYEKDVTAFRAACTEKGIPIAIERSRSGNGAHAWVFFSEPISAQLARRFGSGLLTFTMNKRSEIKFSSYDRLFPNQDTMPSGGFGNLIALPLQGMARKDGNSMFVDENFIPYKDLWAYLSGLKKLSMQQVEQYVAELCVNGDLGALARDTAEPENKPWEKQKPAYIPTAFDFTDVVKITKANMLYIEKEGISHGARNRIKRLAAFKNSDFFKAQAMRLPTYDKPRIISLAEETEKYISLPRGTEQNLFELLESANAKYEFSDETNAGNAIAVDFNGELRDEQQLAIQAMLNQNTGVLSATTAFGKTVIGANIIASRKVNALVLVHTQTLLSQWKKSLEQFLVFQYELPEQPKKRGRSKIQTIIGELGGGKNRLNSFVDIAVMQSLINGDEVKELVRNYGLIIVDECHHVSAVNFEKILKYADAKYVYGLTATPTRQDGHHPIIFMQCGEIRYRVDAKEQALKRPFEHFVIPRFTSFKKLSLNNDSNITQVYNVLAESELRNKLIISDVIAALEGKRNPIILTERSDHVATLARMLSDECDNIITLVGSMSAKEKRTAMNTLQELPSNSQFVIIATGKYVGEGFDFPRLDTLFLAMPIAWKGKVAQYAGRLHRLYDGKNEVLIYDYVDVHIPVLERMYHKRVKGYAAIGYNTKALEQDIQKTSIIYDGKSFLSVFSNDIMTASKNVVIVSPYMRKNRLTQMVGLLSKAVINGVKIIVYTRPPEDFKESDYETVIQNTEYLSNANVEVMYKANIHQKFTIIDEKIVWYGSVNFLSFGSSEESIMRLESYDIAGELFCVL